MVMEAIITRWQKFCINDGPGIRTTFFFKGCPLRCLWCHNPETQKQELELFFREEKCQRCGKCLNVCEQSAISISGSDGKIVLDRSRCTVCLRCVRVCNSGALEAVGTRINVEEAVCVGKQDAVFYVNSGGGITLSGGEPLLQANFIYGLLEHLKESGLSVAVDTCGHVPWVVIENCIPMVDCFLYDIKHIDERKHIAYTGVSNRLILDNAKKLCQIHTKCIARIPVIPGFNATSKDMHKIAAYVKQIGFHQVDLLPFHSFAINKYHWLGRAYVFEETPAMEKDEITQFVHFFTDLGLAVSIGG